jgi:hypothetical protein
MVGAGDATDGWVKSVATLVGVCVGDGVMVLVGACLATGVSVGVVLGWWVGVGDAVSMARAVAVACGVARGAPWWPRRTTMLTQACMGNGMPTASVICQKLVYTPVCRGAIIGTLKTAE